MARKKKDKISKETFDLLWGSINENDFLNEDNIEEEEIAGYNQSQMITFIQNVNLMRHFPRVADSLKPVERRALYALYLLKSFPGTKPKKSTRAIGDAMTFHPHGDSSIYGTLVGMAQPFTKKIPLIAGVGNFGNDTDPDDFAHQRYTELTMTKFAMDCFFSDHDEDCLEKIFNTSRDEEEPLVLSSKYPAILINGGFGIATGNSFCIPTYPIKDVVKLIKNLLRDPDYDDIYLIPDIPTGCDVVDNGSLREICDTGNGTLKMRATITIEEDKKRPNIWILRVHNLPWMTSIPKITDSLIKLTRDGILPIKDIEDYSYSIKVPNPNGGYMVRKHIKYDIIINRAHDPNQIRQKLYKRTQLQDSISVNFKVVTDALEVDRLNMRDLALTWINIRREYLRRKVNKKIAKLSAQISFLEILIVLTDKTNLEKTIKIIKNNTSADAVKALMNCKFIEINSYQAEKIVDSKLRAYTAEMHDKYVQQLKECKKELKKYKDMTKSTKIIDDMIDADMDDLLKYDVEGLKSRIVSEKESIEIPDTNHFLAITSMGMIKKLPYTKEMEMKQKAPAFGVFKNHDFMIRGMIINNHDSVMAFDNFGMYSCVPVHEIENTEPSQFGTTVYDAMRLNGQIVCALPFLSNDLTAFVKKTIGNIYIVTLSKNGYLKKTKIQEYIERRNQLNVKACRIREDDELVAAKVVIERKKIGTNMIIYTEQGKYAYIHSDNIAEQSKDSSGLLSIKLMPDDACKGISIIGNKDDYMLIVTENGCLKLSDLDYIGTPGKRKVSSYLATMDPGDRIFFADGIQKNVRISIYTRKSCSTFTTDDIPVRARKSKCLKMIHDNNNKVIYVNVQKMK